MDNYDSSKFEVAIIGIAGRFPEAKNIKEFWENISQGKECVTFFSDDELLEAGIPASALELDSYIKARPYIADVEYFDADFFKINAREASLMDPQHRLFLECVWEAIEDSGYAPRKIDVEVGVFVACDTNTYLLQNVILNDPDIIQSDPLQIKMNDKDYLCTRVSYYMDFTGPSMMLQSACSSSLVAVNSAMESILGGECDLAVAGAVSLTLPNKTGYFYKEGGVVSPDGHCRSFDKYSNGTVYGDGVGVLILKRLSEALKDKDHIYGVIKAVALNNDGAGRVGFTAPGLNGQTEVVLKAMDLADVHASEVDYIEAHGTGTQLGDSIEMAALTKAYSRENRKNMTWPVGSVKPNIGHSSTASGIAGILKVVLSLKHGVLPPTINYKKPNSNIDFANNPFYINTEQKEWKRNRRPRIAAISAFGLGGSNAHMIIQEAPVREEFQGTLEYIPIHLSARSEKALDVLEKHMVEFLKANKDYKLQDVAGTLWQGRERFAYNTTVVAKDVKELCDSLEQKNSNYTRGISGEEKKATFIFSGVGEEYENMANELYHKIPVYRQYINKCNNIILQKFHWNMIEYLFRNEYHENKSSDVGNRMTASNILKNNQNKFTELEIKYLYLIVFSLEYAMANTFIELGIQADKFIGYSIGEYVAACLAKVFSLEDVLELIYRRGALINKLEKGNMLSVMLGEKEIKKYLEKYSLSIAAVNTPKICVVSGKKQEISQLEKELKKDLIACRVVPTSYAFHSKEMEPIVQEYKDVLKMVNKQPPETPFISNITGKYITEEQAISNDYWSQHLVETVDFSSGIQTLLEEASIMIEMGAGNSLSSFALQHSNNLQGMVFQTMGSHYKNNGELKSLLMMLSKLWNMGYDINWKPFISDFKYNKVPLPTYPFERKKYWLEPKLFIHGFEQKRPDSSDSETKEKIDRRSVKTEYIPTATSTQKIIMDIWESTLATEGIGIKDNFFEIGGNSLLGVNILFEIKKTYNVSVVLEMFYQDPTINFLASYVDLHEWRNERSEEHTKKDWQEIIL